MDLYATQDGLKKSEIMEKWVAATKSKPSDAVYKKVMGEFAVAKAGGNWKLKTLKD
jgi:hypothetical protein